MVNICFIVLAIWSLSGVHYLGATRTRADQIRFGFASSNRTCARPTSSPSPAYASSFRIGRYDLNGKFRLTPATTGTSDEQRTRYARAYTQVSERLWAVSFARKPVRRANTRGGHSVCQTYTRLLSFVTAAHELDDNAIGVMSGRVCVCVWSINSAEGLLGGRCSVKSSAQSSTVTWHTSVRRVTRRCVSPSTIRLTQRRHV